MMKMYRKKRNSEYYEKKEKKNEWEDNPSGADDDCAVTREKTFGDPVVASDGFEHND